MRRIELAEDGEKKYEVIGQPFPKYPFMYLSGLFNKR
jgi:hypothetical protein